MNGIGSEVTDMSMVSNKIDMSKIEVDNTIYGNESNRVKRRILLNPSI